MLVTSLLDKRITAHTRRCGTSAFLSYECTPETWHNVCIQSKTQSPQCARNGSNLLRLIEHKCSMSLQLLLKGRGGPMRGTRPTERLIESCHCVVSSMGLRCPDQTKQDSKPSMRQKRIEHFETHSTQMFNESPTAVKGPWWTNERHEIH